MRSTLELTAALTAAFFLLPACSVAPTGDVESRTFEFTYNTRIPAPDGTNVLEVWVPVASNDAGVQDVELLDWKASDGEAKITRDDLYGNRMIHVLVKNPKPITQITWRARITRYADTGQGSLPSNPRYLQASSLIPIDGKALEMAKDLGVTDASLSVTERAKRIYDDVLGEMAYDKKHEGWGMGSFEHATTVCKGNCTDFHSRFIGVGRAAGMPVRFTMGIPMKPAKTGKYNSYHCWAHYLDGKQWRPVDISEADKVVATDPAKAERFFGHLDPNRVSLSFGRDVPLVPPAMSGTQNYFVFPHAEADGRAVKMKKGDNWDFAWQDVD